MAAKKKVKTVKKTKSKLPVVKSSERTFPLLEKFLQFGLLLIVLLSPYYRGLYFDYERYPFFLVIFLIAIIYFFYQTAYQKKAISIKTPVEYFFLLTVLLYGLSISWAADQGMAFREFFSSIGYFVFFLLVTNIFQTTTSKKNLLKAFNINAVLLVLLGFFYRFGWINPLSRPLGMSMKDLFLESSGRLQSTMQYPNTFAAYLALAIITLILICILEEKPVYLSLWGFLLFFLQIGLYFTYSRGAFLIFILTLVVLFLLLKRKGKIKYLLVLMVALVLTILFTPRLENYLFNYLPGLFFGFLIIGSLIQAFSVYAISFVGKKLVILPKSSIRTSYLAVGIGITLVLVVLIVLILKPAFLGDRFRQITLNAIISQERWIFYGDGLKIFQARPIAGWGGGGWKACYLAHQSYPYFSENTHNYFLQVLIETGIIGLLLTIGLIIGIFYQTYYFKKVDKDNWNTLFVLGLGVVVFLGFFHGFIDVDFALGSFYYGILVFIAFINQITRSQEITIKNRHFLEMKIPSWVMFSIAIFLVIFSLFLISGERAKIWGGFYASQGDIHQAIQYHQKAVNSIPFNSPSHYLLSTYYRELFNTQKQTEQKIKSEYHSEKATSYSRYNYRYQENKAVLKIEKGDFDAGLIDFEKAIYLAPFISTTYEHYLQTCLSVADFYLSQSDEKTAIIYLEKGLHIDDVYTAYLNNSIRPVEKTAVYNSILQSLKTKLEEIRE